MAEFVCSECKLKVTSATIEHGKVFCSHCAKNEGLHSLKRKLDKVKRSEEKALTEDFFEIKDWISALGARLNQQT